MSYSDIQFRRVLTISNVPVTPYSAQGASRGSWFRGWDKDCLAMMSFARAESPNEFANHLFHITLNERLGGLLFKSILKPAELTKTSNNQLESKHSKQKKGFKKTLKALAGLIMYPKYSKRLKTFMDEFDPELIFSTVADCYGARLARFLAKKRQIPYIIQQEDNWLVSDAQNPVLRVVLKAVRTQCLRNSLKNAKRRYVICPGMKDYFEDKFSMPFESLLCADEPKRFLEPAKHEPDKQTVFLYIGNSRPGRSAEFIKIAEAIKQARIKNPEFRIYSTNAYKEDVDVLNTYGFVKFFDTPHHNDVPKVLSKAHVLILAESFEPSDIEYTHLALSSKVQIYMMAKVPILVFASPKTGLMDYAEKTKFGQIVKTDNQSELNHAVDSIVNDKRLRVELVERAYEVALKNHNAETIRNYLKSAINEICKNS